VCEAWEPNKLLLCLALQGACCYCWCRMHSHNLCNVAELWLLLLQQVAQLLGSLQVHLQQDAPWTTAERLNIEGCP
jgi:hypothetical protein